MKTFSQTETSIKDQRIDYINQRWGQLYALEKESGEKALRYLLLTNSGGAIATLSFIGASREAFEIAGVKISLCLFILGIFLVGISSARQYHAMAKIFKSWKSSVNEYFDDKLSYQTLNSNDEILAKEGFLDFAIPYTSFGCFIGGCIAGAFSLLC